MVMSNDVRKIHLSFAVKINEGHFGPRKFWHTYLPRLKYHNPAIPMTVHRTEDQSAPATMTITFGPPSTAPSSSASPTPRTSASGAPPPSSTTSTPDALEANENITTKNIDMKHKHESTILSELTQLVNGQQIEATEEEKMQLQELEDQRARSEQDAGLQKEVLRKKRREQAILEQARRSVEPQAG